MGSDVPPLDRGASPYAPRLRHLHPISGIKTRQEHGRGISYLQIDDQCPRMPTGRRCAENESLARVAAILSAEFYFGGFGDVWR
jgi:hypothetical protein